MLLPWFSQTVFYPVPPHGQGLHLTAIRGTVDRLRTETLNMGLMIGLWEDRRDNWFLKFLRGNKRGATDQICSTCASAPSHLSQRGGLSVSPGVVCNVCPWFSFHLLDNSIPSVPTLAPSTQCCILPFSFPLFLSPQPRAGVGRHIRWRARWGIFSVVGHMVSGQLLNSAWS